MKKQLLPFLLLPCIALAQNVPAGVKAAFAKQYPQATTAKWEKEGDLFEAEFTEAGKEHSAVFDAQGNLQESEIEIPVSDLPAAIKATVAEQFPAANIKEAAQITAASGALTYEVEIKGKDYFFSADGKSTK